MRWMLEYWSWAMQWITAIVIVIALSALGSLLVVLYWRDWKQEVIARDVKFDIPTHRDIRDLAAEADEGGRAANEWEDWQKWDRVI